MTRAMDTLILTRAVIVVATEPICPKLASRQCSWEKFRRSWWKTRGQEEAVAWPRATRPRLVMRGQVGRDHITSHTTKHMSRSHPLRLRRRRSECGLGWPAEGAHSGGVIPAKSDNSIENIADFLPREARNSASPNCQSRRLKARRVSVPGKSVRHPKDGEGTVYQREGEGEDAKITVKFPRSISRTWWRNMPSLRELSSKPLALTRAKSEVETFWSRLRARS